MKEEGRPHGNNGKYVAVSIQTRLMRRMACDPMTGCWNWTGSVNTKGYGKLKIWDRQELRRRFLGAHRVAYTTFVGEIPSGIQVLHSCDNPKCINPEHLFLGTHADNMRDMSNKGRGRGRCSKPAAPKEPSNG